MKTLQRECRHLEEILNDFLQFARLGELELVESDLNQFVRDFVEFYQAASPRPRDRNQPASGLRFAPRAGRPLRCSAKCC